MLVICYGMAKSGSTLAFELTKGVLIDAGHSQDKVKSAGLKPRNGGNYIAELTQESVTELIETIGTDRIVVAKTHQCFEPDTFAWFEDLQRQRKLQIISSYRDPRDMCLSLVDHGVRSRNAGQKSYAHIANLTRAANLIEKAIPKFRNWASLEGSMRLYYDTVAFAPDIAIDAIEKVLGVTCNHEEAKKHAFEDAFTQRNKGQKKRFEDEMNESEKAQMLDTFGEFIERVCGQNDEGWFSSHRERLLAGAAS
jgi:hypothetical protein